MELFGGVEVCERIEVCEGVEMFEYVEVFNGLVVSVEAREREKGSSLRL